MATLTSFVLKYSKVLKYLISGGSAAVINLGVLYVFTEYFGVWYLASSGIAFVFAFMVSFTLQKFWTFGDASVQMIKKQLMLYLVAAAFNLAINTVLMYAFVEHLGIHYFFAQIITSGIIAIGSFFVYQHLIFKTTPPEGGTL